jgi:hypothetical protein
VTSGGARNRSGPQKDPSSLRSAGLTMTALPSEGYGGEAPDFPLPQALDREVELWTQAWTTPQACAWALEPWRWLTVAMWVRTFAVCEGLEATAADKSSLHRFADQIGMTPAGLKENGWAVARDVVAAKRSESAPQTSARDRMKVVQGGDGS